MSEVVAKTRDLPEDWELIEFEDIVAPVKHAMKRGPFGSALKKSFFVPDGHKVYEQKNAIQDDAHIGEYFINDKKYDELEKFKVEPGDFIISCSGTIGRITRIPANAKPGIINQALLKIKINDEIISPQYFLYFFRSDIFQKKVLTETRGVAIKNIASVKDIKKLPVPLPPIEQQKRIVAKIEELFSHIDAGIEALKKAKQRLKQYRQSVLNAAVTGELTKEWREANKDKLEPASQLLERILKERRQKWEEQQLEQFKAKGKMPKDDKWKEKYKEPVQVENAAELEALPGTWEWVCLDSLIVDGPQNGLYLPKTKYGSGVPIVRIDDFQDGYVRPYGNLQKVNANKSEIETYSLQTGNLVINRVNSPTHLGKCMVVKEGYNPCLFESNMMKSELSSNVSADYVDYYIQSKFGRSRLIRNAKWAVNQASINQQDVKNTEITLPPFEEQIDITRLVSEKFDGIDRLNNEIDIQLSKAEKNKQSVLASAFSGKV